jgi:hypothetical protein
VWGANFEQREANASDFEPTLANVYKNDLHVISVMEQGFSKLLLGAHEDVPDEVGPQMPPLVFLREACGTSRRGGASKRTSSRRVAK